MSSSKKKGNQKMVTWVIKGFTHLFNITSLTLHHQVLHQTLGHSQALLKTRTLLQM